MDIMTKNNLLGADDRSGSDSRGRQDVSFGRQTPRKIAMDDGCGVVTKDGEIAQGRRRGGRKSKSKIVEKKKKKGGRRRRKTPFCVLLSLFCNLMIVSVFFVLFWVFFIAFLSQVEVH